ncbi:hypothetical protein ABEF95_002330 [Exophiala dermatitidis]
MSYDYEAQSSVAGARLVDKSLPELPKISVESHQRHAQMETEACPSPTVRKYDELRTSPRSARSRLPPFQQSKKWAAKKHNSTHPAPTRAPLVDEISMTVHHEPVEDPDDRIPTMREVSFEQQRAELKQSKTPVIQKRHSDRPRRPRHVSQSSSTVQEDGICPPRATNYWKTVKATVVIRPHRTARKCFGRRPVSRRASLARQREPRGGRAAGRAPLPAKVRSGKEKLPSQVTSPTRSSTLHKAVSLGSPSAGLNGSYREKRRVAKQRSPIPSLHDPEKDTRFSEECRAILSSMDFNRDWLLPAASVLPAVGRLSGSGVGQLTQRSRVIREDPNQEISVHDALSSVPEQSALSSVPEQSVEATTLIPAITVTTTPSVANSPRGQRPQAPARVSSRTVGSLATMMQMAQSPECPVVSESSSNPSSVTPAQLWTDTPGTQFSSHSQWLQRAPSATSTVDHPIHSPKSVMSTDTLTKIEAQIRSISRFASQRDARKMSISRSDSRSGGPVGIPPERPLPALPAEANVEKAPGQGSAAAESRRGSKEESAMHTPASPSRPTSRLAQDLPRSRQPPSLLPSVALSAEATPISSLKREDSGRSSTSSSRTFNRHTISGPRADRVKEKRMRDLANSRSNSPKSDCGAGSSGRHESSPRRGVNDVVGPAPAGQQSVDQLDQFPAVPSSRPTSFSNNASSPTRHDRRQSTFSQTSSVRQLSSSKSRRGSCAPQKLSQSNIFVVVDSDPVTARFRAGAMSPTPSIGGGRMRGGSPAKTPGHVRTGSNLRQVTTNEPDQQSPIRSVKQKTSLQSLKGEDDSTSARSSPVKPRKTRRAARNSSGQWSSSSDEYHQQELRSPKKTLSRAHKRRRWNSGDIGLIKTLHQDLEEYYETMLKQEERIRWQAQQIQMMMRVFAPINRARGIKTFSPYVEIDDPAGYYTTTDDEETNYPRPQNSFSRIHQTAHSEPMSQQHAGGMDNVVGPNQRHHHHRTNSAGNDSTASSTGSLSTDASKSLGGDEASMTDPFEYDPPPSAMLKPAPRGSAKTFSNKQRDYNESIVAVPSSPTLHQPDDDDRKDYSATKARQQRFDQQQEREGTQNSREAARLSINHVLTNTEQMDRAIEQFALYGRDA